MASSYYDLTTARTTTPDPGALLTALRAAVDPLAGIAQIDATHYRAKKPTPWTDPEKAAAQNALETAAAVTAQSLAQHEIDSWPIAMLALVLALIDEINIIRAALPTPLPARTRQQAITAIRNKASTL